MSFSAASMKAALRRQQGANQAAFEGEIKLAGKRISPCAVKQQAFTVSIPGGGATESRGVSVTFDKALLNGEPTAGSIVVEQEREYIVNSISGHESWSPLWKLTCIERERA